MRRTPIRAVSDRRRKRDSDYPEARREVFRRAGGCCEVGVDPRCSGMCEQVHHRAGRGGEDPHRLANLLGCCAFCHAWLHANPEESRARGWSRTRHA